MKCLSVFLKRVFLLTIKNPTQINVERSETVHCQVEEETRPPDFELHHELLSCESYKQADRQRGGNFRVNIVRSGRSFPSAHALIWRQRAGWGERERESGQSGGFVLYCSSHQAAKIYK